MSTSIMASYKRTLLTNLVVLLLLIFSFSSLRLSIYESLLPFFEWLDTSPLGYPGKTWGALFAFVEAIHLLGMAVLGGTIIVGDGRIMGWIFTDFSLREILDKTHKVFVRALITIIATGLFMACAVSQKLYYMPVFWYKMLALLLGALFVFFVRRPLLKHDLDQINPAVLKLMAISSAMIWFTVAATGRWIGFS